MALGKLGGEKVIVKAFSSTQYSEEDLKYVASIFVTAPIRRCGTPSTPATTIKCRSIP
jgi:hypothetical protein